MKTLKYIGQLLAALVYTPIYTFILYALIVFPIIWFASMSLKWIIIAVIFFGGVIEGLIFLMKFIGFIPFAWIFKDNKCAVWISAAIMVILTVICLYSVWSVLSQDGDRGIIAAGGITLLTLQSVILSVLTMFGVSLTE